MFNGVIVNKLNGGLGNTSPSTDGVMLLAYVVALADLPAGVTHYSTTECLQIADLEAKGFTVAWDANKHSLVHSEVAEFFRICPEGRLYFMPVPTALTPAAIMDTDGFKAAIRAVPDVKIIGINGTSETAAALAALVETVQARVATWAAENRLIDAVILGAKGTATATAVSAYLDLRTYNAPNVSISIAQDRGVATLDTAYALYASVGAVLGGLAVRQINENLGSTDIINKPGLKKADETYPLSDAGKWAVPALSDGTLMSGLSLADMASLTNKGYIYAGSYNGFPGVYFNSSPTCVSASSDYAFIENNRVWNKAARLIRRTLLPKVKGTVKKDPVTGYIKGTTIAGWENLLKKAFDTQLMATDQISGYGFFIDPKQTPNATTPLKVKATVVVDGIVHEFDVDLGLSNNV